MSDRFVPSFCMKFVCWAVPALQVLPPLALWALAKNAHAARAELASASAD